MDKLIVIDQAPIGRNARSNPATFSGVFDEIRALFASTKEAKRRGYKANRFSFNAAGGRCETCKGLGTRRVEMYFLPDSFEICPDCHGKQFNHPTLEIRYRQRSIADVLTMTIEDALVFFQAIPKIAALLQAFVSVGLGYLTLGQSALTLSGGEAQRVKLATCLARGPQVSVPNAAPGPAVRGLNGTMYVLDEPTFGLHWTDVAVLLKTLFQLTAQGDSVLVIEHNLDVIRAADWLIDLGPEGGDNGGQIVAVGTPEQVAANPASITGRFI